MKNRKFSYKELADVFCVDISQISNYVKTNKFNPNDVRSIFDFYARTVFDIHDRRREKEIGGASRSLENMRRSIGYK